MTEYSTRQAAQKLGISLITLQRYIAKKKIPVPSLRRVGAGKFRIWTKQDIEAVRHILPSLKNGRKIRYQKKQSAKPKAKKQPQPRAAHGAPGSSTVPHKQSHKKK